MVKGCSSGGDQEPQKAHFKLEQNIYQAQENCIMTIYHAVNYLWPGIDLLDTGCFLPILLNRMEVICPKEQKYHTEER